MEGLTKAGPDFEMACELCGEMVRVTLNEKQKVWKLIGQCACGLVVKRTLTETETTAAINMRGPLRVRFH